MPFFRPWVVFYEKRVHVMSMYAIVGRFLFGFLALAL
jgi:hypothetical protein